MQIHELNNFSANPDSGFLAIDDGNDTGKIMVPDLLADVNAEIDSVDTNLNARIDNIIAGGTAPSAAEVTDARFGFNGVTYPSLGSAIRGQASDLEDDLSSLAQLCLKESSSIYRNPLAVTAGIAVPAANQLFGVKIPNGAKWSFRINDSIGAISTFYLYANGTNLQGNRSVNTDYEQTATEDITKVSIYVPYSNVLVSGTVIAQLTVYTENSGSIEERVDSHDIPVEIVEESGLSLDLGTLIDGGYVAYNSGYVFANPNYEYSDYIDISPLSKIGVRVSFSYEGGYAFYNSSKNYISGGGIGAYSYGDIIPVTVPNEARYIRTCRNKQATSNAEVIIKDLRENLANILTPQIINPCDYAGDEINVFNKILCVGDSLTKGTFNYRLNGSTNNYIEDVKYSYPTYLEKLTGITVTNKGIGGYTSKQWYQAEQNEDLSGYDLAIIQLGVNDVGQYSTWGQDSIDAFTNIINKLKNENKNIKIFVANIIPATSYSSAGYLAFSAALLSWVETTYASDPNVIPLDMQQYGHTASDAAYNCGHLSALGYARLAQDYKAYISYYISNHKSEFSEVQFIGTNYQYHA